MVSLNTWFIKTESKILKNEVYFLILRSQSYYKISVTLISKIKVFVTLKKKETKMLYNFMSTFIHLVFIIQYLYRMCINISAVVNVCHLQLYKNTYSEYACNFFLLIGICEQKSLEMAGINTQNNTISAKEDERYTQNTRAQWWTGQILP